MRTIIAAIILLAVFFILVQLLPPSWYLPLYCLFTVSGMAYGWRQWQGINERRRILWRELEASRPDLSLPFEEEE